MVKRNLLAMIALFLLTALACNAPFSSDAEAEPVVDSTSEADTATTDTADSVINETTETQLFQDQIEDETGSESAITTVSGQGSGAMSGLTGIRQGLASLDTFRVVMNTVNNGPTELDVEESYIEIRNNSSEKAQHMRTENISSSSEYPEETRSIEDQYQIDLVTCTLSTYDGETSVDVQEMTPLERDMVSSSSGLFDVIITAENAELVGEEVINDIPVNHYSFKITGLGDYSGDEVTQADGAYWLATDGGYLVKYNIVLEIRTAPEGDAEAEVMHAEYNYDLLDVNQPITITLPEECSG